jgi:hypothetical protein
MTASLLAALPARVIVPAERKAKKLQKSLPNRQLQ